LREVEDVLMSHYKALTIKQPWLYAIMELGKTVENRDWEPPSYIIDQRIALHASRSYDKDGDIAIARITGYQVPRNLPRGCFLATATISGVVTEEEVFSGVVSLDITEWFCGRYGWLLDYIRPLDTPIVCKGQLGLWSIPDECLRRSDKDSK
jgi:hypothetical protein